MLRVRCRASCRTRSCPSFCAYILSRHLATATVPSVGDTTSLITRRNSRSTVESWFSPNSRSFAGSLFRPTHCLLRVYHCPQGCVYLVFCRFDLESVCDRPLGKPCDDVGFDAVIFCIEKGAEEPRPPSENEPWISQLFPLFVTDVLRTALPCVFFAQGLEAWEESLLIAPVQLLLQTLDVYLKEPCVCSVADPLNMRVSSPGSSF